MQKPLIPALFLLALLSFGCGKSTDSPDNATAWVVTFFNDKVDKDDDTALFTGYSFDLNTDNSMVIYLPGGSTKAAKWRLENNDTQLIIVMDDADMFAPVDGLVGQWDVQEYTATSIKLTASTTISTAPNPNQGEKVELKKQ